MMSVPPAGSRSLQDHSQPEGGRPESESAIPDVLEQRIEVAYGYSIHFTRDLFAPGNETLATALCRREPGRRHRALVVIDDGVAAAWPALTRDIVRYFDAHARQLQLLGEPMILPGGEAAKNDPAVAERIVAWTNERGIDRQSFIIAVGGGAFLDAVGLGAAVSHRGVRLVRIPTTVLAQNDSGVGVKNGINWFGKKNYVGTFAPPFAVLNDFDFLRTLSRTDLIAGMSEAVKVGLIRDRVFFEWLEANAAALGAGDEVAVEYSIRRCAQLHLAHIATSGDPFELGSARPLDFGHWAAHKLEALTSYAIPHGHAVAIGIALDTVYSGLAGHLGEADVNRVLDTLEQIGFELWSEAFDLRGEDGQLSVLRGLREFREHLGGDLSVTLLKQIGSGFETHEIDEDRMREALDRLRARHQNR